MSLTAFRVLAISSAATVGTFGLSVAVTASFVGTVVITAIAMIIGTLGLRVAVRTTFVAASATGTRVDRVILGD